MWPGDGRQDAFGLEPDERFEVAGPSEVVRIGREKGLEHLGELGTPDLAVVEVPTSTVQLPVKRTPDPSGAAPFKRDVLARLSVPLPLEAKLFRPITGGDGPCRDSTTGLGTWRVESLYTLTRWGCRSR